MYFKMRELCMKKKFLSILRFYNFTIRVYFIFFVPCQKCVFDNLDDNHTKPATSYLIKKFIFSFCFVLYDI